MFAPFAAGSGHPSCPCIDPWAHGLKLNGNAPQAVVAGCEIKRSDSGACFPMSYGSTGCDSHSATADAECMVTTSEAPTWCSSRWCYVDATNCFRPSQSSIYFADARLPASILTNWTGSNQLTFSYETCDNLDQYSSSSEGAIFFLRNFIASRPGGKLRVSFPNDYMGAITLPATWTILCRVAGQRWCLAPVCRAQTVPVPSLSSCTSSCNVAKFPGRRFRYQQPHGTILAHRSLHARTPSPLGRPTCAGPM